MLIPPGFKNCGSKFLGDFRYIQNAKNPGQLSSSWVSLPYPPTYRLHSTFPIDNNFLVYRLQQVPQHREGCYLSMKRTKVLMLQSQLKGFCFFPKINPLFAPLLSWFGLHGRNSMTNTRDVAQDRTQTSCFFVFLQDGIGAMVADPIRRFS